MALLLALLLLINPQTEIYTGYGVVTEVTGTEVSFETPDGNVWGFEGGNWQEGDTLKCAMYNNGTPEIEDDIILGSPWN